MTATAKKQKPLKRHPSKLKKMSAYMILTLYKKDYRTEQGI